MSESLEEIKFALSSLQLSLEILERLNHELEAVVSKVFVFLLRLPLVEDEAGQDTLTLLNCLDETVVVE